MTVSVICLCYNHSGTLNLAFNSILNQTLSEDIILELIIIDDHSNDESAFLLEELVNNTNLNIRLVLNEINLGASESLVKGLKLASGRYIVILEMDDYWHNPERILTAVSFLEKRQNVFALNDGVRRQKGNNFSFEGQFSHWNGASYVQRTYRMNDWQDCSYPGHISALTFRNFNNTNMANRCMELIQICHRNVADITLIYVLLGFGDFVCRDYIVSTYRIVSKSGNTNYTSQIKRKNSNLDRNIQLAKIIKYHRLNYNKSLPINRNPNEVIAESILFCLRFPNIHNLEALRVLYSNTYQLNSIEIRVYEILLFLIKLVWQRIF